MVIIYHMFRSCRTLATNIHTNYPLRPVRIHYLLGAPFGRERKIILWFDISVSLQLLAWKVRQVLCLIEIFLLSKPLLLSRNEIIFFVNGYSTVGSFVVRSSVATWTLKYSSIERLTFFRLPIDLFPNKYQKSSFINFIKLYLTYHVSPTWENFGFTTFVMCHVSILSFLQKLTKTGKLNNSAEPANEFKVTAVLPDVKFCPNSFAVAYNNKA